MIKVSFIIRAHLFEILTTYTCIMQVLLNLWYLIMHLRRFDARKNTCLRMVIISLNNHMVRYEEYTSFIAYEVVLRILTTHDPGF